MKPVFLDADVPMYASGAAHPLKDPCARIIALAARRPDAFLTDAEVLQEIVHRYLTRRRWPEGRALLDRFALIMEGRVEPVYATDVLEAAALADDLPGLGSRDLLHAAVMRRSGIHRVVTADRGFDRIAGIERIDPAAVDTWTDEILSG